VIATCHVYPRRCRAEKVRVMAVPAPQHNQRGSRGRMPRRASLASSLRRDRLDQVRVAGHSMTSSARARIDGGIVSFNSRAVFKLM
jgi:hypothetical protein